MFFPIICSLVSLLLSQVLKLFYFFWIEKKFSTKPLLTAGGMPSSHSAILSAFATALALQWGITSPIFQLSVIVSVIVFYDAYNVRHEAGKHAEVLNQWVREKELQTQFPPLKERLGHTGLEVFVGIIVGIGTTIFIAFY